MARRAAMIVVLLCVYLAPSTASLAKDSIAQMERAISSKVSNQQFMGSVLVARDGKILLSKGFGFANLEWQIPNTPQTKFRLGSITKQFTAASILLLEERGKLKLADPINKYIPGAPAAWERVTILHLLTHTAGIPNFTDFPDYQPTQFAPTTPAQLVARFRDRPLEFQPGEGWRYSNSGYALLGYLIEILSGQTYEDFVQENILKPADMKDSGYDSNSAIIARRASGYSPSADGPVNADYIHMSIPFAAGALYSTPEDMLRWNQQLFGGKLLSAHSLQEMLTPVRAPGANGYALGLRVRDVRGHKVIGHQGGIDGFSTAADYYPQDKVSVIVLANLSGPASGELAAVLGLAALSLR